MKKDTYYFSHDYNARNDEKILELRAKFGAEGYGIFWMLVETMAENDNCGIKASLLGGLSLGYGVAIGRLKEILTLCKELNLFHEKDGYFFSNRLLSHKEMRNKFKEFGIKGAKTRWGGYSHPNSPPNGEGNAKERKGKERKVREYTEFTNSEESSKEKEKINKKEKESEIPYEPQPNYPIPQNFGKYYLPKYKVVVFEDETCQPLSDLEFELLETRQLRSWLIQKDFGAAKPLSEVVADHHNRTRRTETAQISPQIKK